MRIKRLNELIDTYNDFPKKGIDFKDVLGITQEPLVFKELILKMSSSQIIKNSEAIISIDARGFIFGSLIASSLGKGFIPVRKEGKLPWQTESQAYDLEYGKSVIEIHKDAIKPSERVLIVDDLLATGGTASAAVKLVEKLKGKVQSLLFFIELEFLNGRKMLEDKKVGSVLKY